MAKSFFYASRKNADNPDAPETLLRFPSRASRDEWAEGPGRKALDKPDAEAAFPAAFQPPPDAWAPVWRAAVHDDTPGAEEFA